MISKILNILSNLLPKEPEIVEAVKLTPREEIKKIDDAIAGQYSIWNNTTDNDVIDSCIYHITALNKQRESIQSELKAM
jgi:hypothetical protein